MSRPRNSRTRLTIDLEVVEQQEAHDETREVLLEVLAEDGHEVHDAHHMLEGSDADDVALIASNGEQQEVVVAEREGEFGDVLSRGNETARIGLMVGVESIQLGKSEVEDAVVGTHDEHAEGHSGQDLVANHR